MKPLIFPSNRIQGLDSIRFIAALFVAVDHLVELPPYSNLNQSNFILKALYLIHSHAISGAAAVIVFFVISGFCINYPYTSGKPMNIPEFYTKRLLRIGIPMIVSFLLGSYFNLHNLGVLWSLEAEIIYYLLFPLLLWLRRFYNWNTLIIASFLISYIIITVFVKFEASGDIITGFPFGIYPRYGYLNFLVGLPCWLLGVKLAEVYRAKSSTYKPVTSSSIILYRLVAWGGLFLSKFLYFHANIGYNLSLNFFAIIVYFWLEKEILYFRDKKPLTILEQAGSWSYSLYLCHNALPTLFIYMSIPYFNFTIHTLLLISAALIVSYLFYLLVEKPSHKLSKGIDIVKLKGVFTQN